MSEKYYVSGCRSTGEEIERCEDSEATFWTLYERDSEGLSQGVIDCVFREDAVAAMTAYVERDRLNEQVRVLAAEVSSVKSHVENSVKAIRHWNQWADSCDHIPENIETTAADAILNEVRALARAEGIHFAANRLLAAWESGFVDDTPAEAHDISGAILSALEFLPNADDGEFKRDYADEVRARIRVRIRDGELPNV